MIALAGAILFGIGCLVGLQFRMFSGDYRVIDDKEVSEPLEVGAATAAAAAAAVGMRPTPRLVDFYGNSKYSLYPSDVVEFSWNHRAPFSELRGEPLACAPPTTADGAALLAAQAASEATLRRWLAQYPNVSEYHAATLQKNNIVQLSAGLRMRHKTAQQFGCTNTFAAEKALFVRTMHAQRAVAERRRADVQPASRNTKARIAAYTLLDSNYLFLLDRYWYMVQQHLLQDPAYVVDFYFVALDQLAAVRIAAVGLPVVLNVNGATCPHYGSRVLNMSVAIWMGSEVLLSMESNPYDFVLYTEFDAWILRSPWRALLSPFMDNPKLMLALAGHDANAWMLNLGVWVARSSPAVVQTFRVCIDLLQNGQVHAHDGEYKWVSREAFYDQLLMNYVVRHTKPPRNTPVGEIRSDAMILKEYLPYDVRVNASYEWVVYSNRVVIVGSSARIGPETVMIHVVASVPYVSTFMKLELV